MSCSQPTLFSTVWKRRCVLPLTSDFTVWTFPLMVQSCRGGYWDMSHPLRTCILVMGFWRAMMKRLFELKEVAITNLNTQVFTSKFISVKGEVSWGFWPVLLKIVKYWKLSLSYKIILEQREEINQLNFKKEELVIGCSAFRELENR